MMLTVRRIDLLAGLAFGYLVIVSFLLPDGPLPLGSARSAGFGATNDVGPQIVEEMAGRRPHSADSH
jgi:hypothetical protein